MFIKVIEDLLSWLLLVKPSVLLFCSLSFVDFDATFSSNFLYSYWHNSTESIYGAGIFICQKKLDVGHQPETPDWMGNCSEVAYFFIIFYIPFFFNALFLENCVQTNI